MHSTYEIQPSHAKRQREKHLKIQKVVHVMEGQNGRWVGGLGWGLVWPGDGMWLGAIGVW